jgi:hypothetical protein
VSGLWPCGKLEKVLRKVSVIKTGADLTAYNNSTGRDPGNGCGESEGGRLEQGWISRTLFIAGGV